MAWHVVIAGGGFGGLYAARTLERSLPPQSARITVVNDVNFMLYTPLLPGAAAGTLEPRHVVVPLREELKRADLRLGSVVGARPHESVLQVQQPEGSVEDLRYDQLIVALGSITRIFPIPGLAEHGIGFKTLPEAIAIRNRLLRCFEIAENMEDGRERAAYLTFVFVGAGYAGVEGLAELQDFAADAIDLYPRCKVTGVRFMMVEARDRLMGEIPAPLADFALRELRGRGIEVRLSTQLAEVQRDRVKLSTGEWIPTHTLAWTAGVKAHPVVGEMGLPLSQSGRIQVDSYLQVEGFDNVWAIGDAAAVPDAAQKYKGETPPTAQHAMRQGRTVARNVAATIGAGGRKRKFTYKTLGVFVDMGRSQAVAQTLGIRWRGRPAWFLARTYHVLLMPSMGRRARLIADWTIGLFFGRDASELGMLGHPPELHGQSSGGTGADGTPIETDGLGARSASLADEVGADRASGSDGAARAAASADDTRAEGGEVVTRGNARWREAAPAVDPAADADAVESGDPTS
jgi:NADH dehydrogenase